MSVKFIEKSNIRPIRPRKDLAKDPNDLNLTSFQHPQAESTSINSNEKSNSSNGSTSTIPPEIQTVQDITEPYVEPLVWAKLDSMSSKYNSADIHEDTFKFGKKDNLQLLNDKVIKKSISNEHFIIQVNNFQKFSSNFFKRLFAHKIYTTGLFAS